MTGLKGSRGYCSVSVIMRAVRIALSFGVNQDMRPLTINILKRQSILYLIRLNDNNRFEYLIISYDIT